MLLPRYLVQSYEKSSAEQKKLVSFLCRDGVTYLKLRKIESRTKETRFFLCRDGVTQICLYSCECA